MKSLPSDVVPYHRTPEYSKESVPPSFLDRSHSTKAGVWARISVVEGTLRYRILEPEAEEHLLDPDRPGVIEPEVPHTVEPVGEARFFIEFLRAP